MDEIIRFTNYGFEYRTGYPILSNLNLSLTSNQLVLVMGPSGCGKSTFLLSINGIVPNLTGGRVHGKLEVCGKNTLDSSPPELSKEVGFVFQNPDDQLCSLNVREEIAFGPENLLIDEKIIRNKVEKVLSEVGLSGFDFRDVFKLSGGEKQRLAIASALVLDPKILILDEPTANIDPKGVYEVHEVIKQIKKERDILILLVEHNIDEISDMVDRAIVFNEKGEIVHNGSLNEAIECYADKMQLHIPQVSDLCLHLREKGVLQKVPLTINEAVSCLKDKIWLSCAHDTTTTSFDSQITEEPVIEINNLMFRYPESTFTLKDINVKIYKGEFVGLLGQNGGGKTTLAQNIIGLLKPQSGSITILGHDTKDTSAEKIFENVGYVFQYPEYQFIKDNVFDEVAFTLRVRKVDEETIQSRVKEILESFDLHQYKDRHPMSLSQGQKRKLSVATVLVCAPKVVIFDEPTMGLDWKTVTEMMNRCKQYQAMGNTVIVITHDMRMIASYANSAMVMCEGQLIYHGPTCELFKREEILSKAFLKPPPICMLSRSLGFEETLTNEEFMKSLVVTEK